MFEYLREVVIGAKSLLTGMAVTAKYGLSKTVTVHYPYEQIDITPNFRGHIDLVMNPKNGKHKCISCMMCQRACPSGCIDIHAEKPEGAKKKQLVWRGTGSDIVSDKPEQNAKKIDKAVADMFKRYPPQ